MCLLFISYKLTPGYKIILAANRDEFVSRPTAPLDFIDDSKTILTGKDLEGGGTWLGINKQESFAALTNFREHQTMSSDAPSRGELIIDYLQSEKTGKECLEKISNNAKLYNGFNLIVGDTKGLYYYSNRGGTQAELSPGFYGLCNHYLDSDWPKVARGKNLLYPHMVQTENLISEDIFNVLLDTERPDDRKLPDTGVGLEWERLLSSIFIDSTGYGTRSSAIITIDYNSRIDFFEKTYLRQSGKIETDLVYRSLNR